MYPDIIDNEYLLVINDSHIGNIDNEWFLTRRIDIKLSCKYPTWFITDDNIRGSRITLLMVIYLEMLSSVNPVITYQSGLNAVKFLNPS